MESFVSMLLIFLYFSSFLLWGYGNRTTLEDDDISNCRKLVTDHTYTYFQQPYGESWTIDDFNKNLKKNIHCGVIYPRDNLIVLVDNHFDVTPTSQNLHIVYAIEKMHDTVFQQMKNRQKIVEIGERYPRQSTYYIVFSSILEYVFGYLKSIFVVQALLVLKNIVLYYFVGDKMRKKLLGDGDKQEKDAEEEEETFESVAGCEEAKAELEEIVDFLKQSEKYEEVGAKVPTGVLLEGPPGTGKTLLARATANEASANFIYSSASEFVEMYVGVGASRVRQLFQKARKMAPCIVFIDEIDAVGGSRDNVSNDERNTTLNELLTSMDGFERNSEIIVMAATNRADMLDPALTRSGRFDRKITVGLPDKEGRKHILKVHLKNKKVANDCNMDFIHELTTGFSGADLATLANEAAILSLRYNVHKITQRCLMDAFEKITIGLPKKGDNRSLVNKTMIAHHEAGHAVTAMYFPDLMKVRRVTINSNSNGAGGYTLFTPVEELVHFPTKRYMLANIIVSLGGRAAESLLFKNQNNKEKRKYKEQVVFQGHDNLDVSTGASNDLYQANQLARAFVTKYGLGEHVGIYDNEDGRNFGMSKLSDQTKQRIDTEVEKMVGQAYEKALQILTKNKKAMESLTDMLLHTVTVDETMLEGRMSIQY